MISLPTFSLIEILIRMMVLGQLLLLACLLAREPASKVRHLLFAGGLSLAAMVMLTAPIPDEDYGLFRNLLLLLTDAFAVIFWLLIRYLFDDEFYPDRWPPGVKLLIALFALIYIYALGVKSGNTPLHDLIHGIGLALIIHAGYVTVRDFADDLLDARRRARIIVTLGISFYSAVLVVFELIDERFRNAAAYGLTNAVLLLLAISIAIARLFRLRHDPVTNPSPKQVSVPKAEAGTTELRTPLSHQSPNDEALAEALDEFIANHGYHQNGMTIKTLADQLDCQEHRLRRLINQTRGFRNFNTWLNELRINDAKARLADSSYTNLPILSIALDLGYDSIGPFNRAFKSKVGQTPGEFRRSFQNRR